MASTGKKVHFTSLVTSRIAIEKRVTISFSDIHMVKFHPVHHHLTLSIETEDQCNWNLAIFSPRIASNSPGFLECLSKMHIQALHSDIDPRVESRCLQGTDHFKIF